MLLYINKTLSIAYTNIMVGKILYIRIIFVPARIVMIDRMFRLMFQPLDLPKD